MIGLFNSIFLDYQSSPNPLEIYDWKSKFISSEWIDNPVQIQSQFV